MTKVSGYKGFSSLSQVKSEGILSPSQVTLFTQNTRNELPRVAGLSLRHKKRSLVIRAPGARGVSE